LSSLLEDDEVDVAGDAADAEADVVVDSSEGSPEATVSRAIAALAACPRAILPPEM